MTTKSAISEVVYHFQDVRLFDAFLEAIPRTDLLETLRNSESIRKRHFRGFHISHSVPTHQQLCTAYRKEIVELNNKNLGNLLCAQWIRHNAALAQSALKALSIECVDSGNVYLWLEEVQHKLNTTSQNNELTALVNSLSTQFSDQSVHIFISIVSHDKDQSALRHLVDDLLSHSAKDLVVRKAKLEQAIELSSNVHSGCEAKCRELEQRRKTEVPDAEERLAGIIGRGEEIAAACTKKKELLQDLTLQLEMLHSQVTHEQHGLDVATKEHTGIVKTIHRQRSELAQLRSDLDNALHALHLQLAAELQRKQSLTAELAEVEILIEKDRNAREAEVLQRQVAPVPLTLPSVRAVSSEEPLLLKQSTRVIDNNTLCYQALQRDFRNAVVSFLRARMTRAFPSDHLDRLQKACGNWDQDKINAAKSRDSLGTTTTLGDDYDLLGINHFFNIFELNYDTLFSVKAGQPENATKPNKSRLLGNLKAIKDARDPMSHPVLQEIPVEEANHITYIAREVLLWLGCPEPAGQLTGVLQELLGKADDGTDLREQDGKAILLGRMPSQDSMYLEWIGRDALLEELAAYFGNADTKRGLLAGDGGKGKSAVAYRFVQTLRNDSGRFQLIIWLSAKQRRFREGAITTTESPDFATLPEALDLLLREFGATDHEMQSGYEDKRNCLITYLNMFPAFLVVDDIDTLLDDVDLVSFFTHDVPHTQSAVLLTSRRSIAGIKTFTVQGFTIDEARDFTNSRIQLYDLKRDAFSPNAYKNIFHATDGSPLYMDDLLRLVRMVDVNQAITHWKDKGGEEARRYALQRELEILTADGKKLLIASAVEERPISYVELRTILEMSDERLMAALSELHNLFLFPKAPAVEGERRYEINQNTRRLVRIVEGESDFYKRVERKIKALSDQLPGVAPTLVGSLARQALLHLNAGQREDAESILRQGIEKYPNAADLYGILGLVYKKWGRITDARTQFESALKYGNKNRDTYLHWQKLEISEKEWQNALRVSDVALGILPKDHEIAAGKVTALRQAGFDFHRGWHREKAERMWKEAVEVVSQMIKSPEELSDGERASNSSMYYAIVVCLDMLKRFKERSQWLERWEKEHPDDPQVYRQKSYLVSKHGSV